MAAYVGIILAFDRRIWGKLSKDLNHAGYFGGQYFASMPPGCELMS